jgi:hypothetical protein
MDKTRKPFSNITPLNSIDARIHRQIERVLTDLEHLPIPPRERVQALYTIGRLQIVFQTLAKGAKNARTGSAVAHYSKAFSHGAGTRAKIARPTIMDAPDGLDDDSDDSDDAA